jgi:folylpolyglutamate synthase/dihydropteroate synthase
MSAAMSLLARLQSSGARWSGGLPAGVAGRDAVASSMAHYLRRLAAADGASPAAPPPPLPPALLVVGTKGKGSTAAMCESVLRSRGLRTGLFTSPHLLCAGERIRVDGAATPAAAFLRAFWSAADALAPELRALAAAGDAGAPPPRGVPGLPGFNFLALLALRAFAAARVDVAVLEAGVGGRLDACCAVVAAPVAVGVAALDFDHTELLGRTLAAIATEKAGAFRAGVPAVTVPQRADALDALAAAAAAAKAPLWLADPAQLARGGAFPALGLDAPFQRANAALAVALADIFMASRERAHAAAPPATLPEPPRAAPLATTPALGAGPPPFPFAMPLPSSTLAGLRAAAWPGRAQTVLLDAAGAALNAAPPARAAARLLLDGAHTAASMAEAARWLRAATAGEPAPRRVLVFACGHEKPAVAMLLALSTLRFDRVLFCTAPAGLAAKRPPPTAAQAIAEFVSRRDSGGSDFGGGSDDAAAAAAASPPPADAWPRTLAALWRAVHCDASLARDRARLAAELAPPGAPAAPLPAAPADAVVCASAELALADALALPPPPAPPTDVVVTGSLYLVAAALRHVRWTEPPPAR